MENTKYKIINFTINDIPDDELNKEIILRHNAILIYCSNLTNSIDDRCKKIDEFNNYILLKRFELTNKTLTPLIDHQLHTMDFINRMQVIILKIIKEEQNMQNIDYLISIL